jgi:hypothetical protein
MLLISYQLWAAICIAFSCYQSQASYHLITFATEGYYDSARLLAGSALRYGGFDVVKIYRPSDLDEAFVEKNKLILNQTRGSGFWIYKPYVIMFHLLYASKLNDVICYLDTNYAFKRNYVVTLNRLLVSEPYIGLYQGKVRPKLGMDSTPEINFTKKDTFVIMNLMNDTYRHSEQAWAGTFALKNTFYGIQFVGQWLTYAQDARILTDDPSIFGKEESPFIDHRHDQSICSLLSKKWGIILQVQNGEEKGVFIPHYENFIINLPNGQHWRYSRSKPEGPSTILKLCEEYGMDLIECRDTYTGFVAQLEQGLGPEDMLPP